MDSEGMVPAFKTSLQALEKMVANLEKNLCDKVDNWTFYDDVLDKLDAQIEATKNGLEQLNNELAEMIEGDNSFDAFAANKQNIVETDEEWNVIENDYNKAWDEKLKKNIRIDCLNTAWTLHVNKNIKTVLTV